MLLPALAPVAFVGTPHLILPPVHDSPVDDKPPPHFYYQQHTVQIIQLVEGQPPPPRRMSSMLGPNSYLSPSTSSSSSSSSSSSDSASSPYSESASECSSSDEGEGGEGSVCSSYCSSDFPAPVVPNQAYSEPVHLRQRRDRDHHQRQQQPYGHPHHPYPFTASDETYSFRMKRVFAWRDHFSADPHTTSVASWLMEIPIPRSSASKRKHVNDAMDDDAMSYRSKHSRSHASSKRPPQTSSLPAYSCPACDASFPSRQSLRQHGLAIEANEACRAAVEYAFE